MRWGFTDCGGVAWGGLTYGHKKKGAPLRPQKITLITKNLNY